MRLEIHGLPEFARKLEAMHRSADSPNVSGTRILAESVLTASKASAPGQGVPVDTGALRASGIATGPDTRGTSTVEFGGASAPYGLRQHETLEYKHTVGEARWLVRALERIVSSGTAVADALKKQTDALIDLARRS